MLKTLWGDFSEREKASLCCVWAAKICDFDRKTEIKVHIFWRNNISERVKEGIIGIYGT